MPTIIYSLQEMKEIFNKVGIEADEVEIIELGDNKEPSILVKTSTPIVVSPATNTAQTHEPVPVTNEEQPIKESKKKATKIDKELQKKFFSSTPPSEIPEVISLDDIGSKE